MPEFTEPILLDDGEVADRLRITPKELDWLVATGQLLPVTICGNRRFLYEHVRDFVRVYQSIQNRA